MTPAERAGDSVLGCLLAFYTPELITVVQARGVAWDDFPGERRRIVYRAILALHKEGVHVDTLTVEAFLARHGKLEQAGGPGYLAICEGSANPSALKDHAFIVAEQSRWDRLLRAWDFMGRAIEEQNESALREGVALLRRDVPEEHPVLRVVDGGRAA